MILAGLKPEIIMEIASRAIAFWTYQVSIIHSNVRPSFKERRHNCVLCNTGTLRSESFVVRKFCGSAQPRNLCISRE